MNQLTDRRREEKDRRRNEILDAAAVVAAETGFDAVTMDQVARRARLSRALVYVYFEDKTALQLALCERALEMLQERFAAATAQAANGLAKLAAIGRAYVTFSQEQPVYFGALVRFEARDTTDMQGAAQRCMELGDLCHQRITTAIRDGIADGSIRADLSSPDAVSLVLWGYMLGVIQIAATKGALLQHRSVGAEELYEQALGLALRGLESKP